MEYDQSTQLPNYELHNTLYGHLMAVSSVKFNGEGNKLASASADSSINIWCGYEGTFEKSLMGHKLGISDISWSNDSKFLISASDDKTLKMWDVDTSRCLQTFQGHDHYVFSCAFNPRSNYYIVSGSFDNTLRLWDTRNPKTSIKMVGHNDYISSVDFSVDGTKIVSASYDGSCKLWNALTTQIEQTITKNAEYPVSFARFTPNSYYILVSTWNSTMQLWDYEKNKVLKTYSGHLNKDYCIVSSFNPNAYNANRQIIVAGSEDHKIYIWSVKSQKIIQALSGHSDVVVCTDCNPKCDIIASAALEKDKTIKLWRNSR